MKTKRVSILDYAFSVGKIRALEKFLIKEGVFLEAIDSDLAGALRLFAESDLYSSELLHIRNSQELESLLNQELSNLKKLVGDLLLDKSLIGLLEMDTIKCVINIARQYPSQFLQDYLSHLIDMHNIKSFLRLYILKEAQEKLEEAIICEGFIRKKDFLELYPQDLVAFLNRLEYVHRHHRTIDYTYYLGEAIQDTVKESSFIYLEKATHDLLIEFLKPAKYFTFGPEPVLAYYFAKVNEMNLIRMIILAKLNAVSEDLVKERLNAVYA